MLLLNQQTAPRGRLPTYVAKIIAFAVVAQALEFAPVAALALFTNLQFHLTGAGEKQRLFFDGAHCWVDAHRLRKVSHCPTLNQSDDATVAQMQISRGMISTDAGSERVAQLRGNTRIRRNRSPLRSFEERGGQIIHETAEQNLFSFLNDTKLDLGGIAQRGSRNPGPCQLRLLGFGQLPGI